MTGLDSLLNIFDFAEARPEILAFHVNFERFFRFTPFVIILIFFCHYNPREFGAVLHDLSGSKLALP